MIIREGLILTVLFIYGALSDIPDCDYFDTVDLTESKRFPNGSYLYDKLVIPAELTGEYDYEILVDGKKVSVPNHLRGCACKLRNCVRFCCHPNQMLIDNERKCSGDIFTALDYDPNIPITLNDGSEVYTDVFEEFVVQRHLPVPCATHFHLDAENYEDEGWKLFENGTLFRYYDNATISKEKYCLQPHPIQSHDGGSRIKLVPHNCQKLSELPESLSQIITIGRIITIIFLLLTIIVYLWLPKLRTLNGYCLVCYIICVILANALLLADSLKSDSTSKFACQTIGYIGYFAVIAGSLWLAVISYNLWNQLRGNNYIVQSYTSRNRFLLYNLYVWSIAALLTIIVVIVDSSLNTDNPNDKPLMPGVAIDNCWIKDTDWSVMIYLYGPIIICIIFNTIMFILALRAIHNQLKRNNVSRDQPKSRFHSSRQTVLMFLLLFVIMGITWMFQIISHLGGKVNSLKSLAEIADYIFLAQGFIIFIIFVLKPSILKQIYNRCRCREATDDEDEASEEGVALQDRKSAVTIVN